MKKVSNNYNTNDLFIGLRHSRDNGTSTWKIVLPISKAEKIFLNKTMQKDDLLEKDCYLDWLKDLSLIRFYAVTDSNFDFRTITHLYSLPEFLENNGINFSHNNQATIYELTKLEVEINNKVPVTEIQEDLNM